jgi:1-aminocyclopropane-1-carboxylate deaminase
MDTIPDKDPEISPLNPTWYQRYVKRIDMLRLDLVHPVVSGNKWYKLKLNIEHALANNNKCILTFGGAYSNHLIATAAAAQQFGLRSTGIVKGLYAKEALTPTLQACERYGMQLVFVSNEKYAQKNNAAYLKELSNRYDRPFIIPEGGANEWGRQGCETIANYIDNTYSHVCVSVGTGTTFIGLRNALPAKVKLNGYVPMKNGAYLTRELRQYISASSDDNWKLFDEWHCGGFGKWNFELIEFMNTFYKLHQVPLDIIYTGKMMYGIQQQLQRGDFPNNATILCIHSGGLQGNDSVKQRLIY